MIAIEKCVIRSIDNRILAQKKTGRREITNPQAGDERHGIPFLLRDDGAKAVRLHYESKGFTWTEHKSPDDYITLSW